MTVAKQPDDVDRYVGSMIRQARREKQLTQSDVAGLMDLTFQQVQKYEKGVNRVSCRRLLKFSEILERPIIYFFPDMSVESQADINAKNKLEKSDLKKHIRKQITAIHDLESLRAIARLVDLAAV